MFNLNLLLLPPCPCRGALWTEHADRELRIDHLGRVDHGHRQFHGKSRGDGGKRAGNLGEDEGYRQPPVTLARALRQVSENPS